MKILLVRLSSMGDLIHTLPAVEDLSKNRSDIELHWLCETGFSDIARLHPFVKKIHEMGWRKWRKHLGKSETWHEIGRLKTRLDQERFDFVLDSQSLIKSAIFAKMANAPVFGLDRQSAREPLASLCYREKFNVPKGKNAVWRNRELFAQVFGYQMPSEMNFGLNVPNEGYLNGLPAQYFVALHATSRDSKLWPLENWLALLQKLYEDTGNLIYLPWGNDTERQRAEEIAAKFPFAKVCGRMNLLQAAYLLDNACGVVGVDTGLLHLANAFDKPLVGIYTDTDPVKTGVQPSKWAVNLGNIGQIPRVDEVFEQLKKSIAVKNGTV